VRRALGTLILAAALLAGCGGEGGEWSFGKCLDAASSGVSRDVLYEHGCV